MIGIIDYGCGNVGSVLNMFSKINIWSEKINHPGKLSEYSALVLPGVGTFDTGVKKLKQSGFWNELNHLVVGTNKPVLGICLGMHLFFEGSEEGNENGFGWLPGMVKRFEETQNYRIPHMSWNQVLFNKSPYNTITNNSFYFAHAYHAPALLNEQYILGKTNYGIAFPSAVQYKNITGFQFHPEKSLNYGMELLQKWELTLHPHDQ